MFVIKSGEPLRKIGIKFTFVVEYVSFLLCIFY